MSGHTPEFTLDWPHGWTTRDGRAVRIITMTEGPKERPIVAVVSGDREMAHTFRKDGTFSDHESAYDLINAPAPKRRVRGWIVVRPRDLTLLADPHRCVPWGMGSSAIYASKEIADEVACDSRGAIAIPIDHELDGDLSGSALEGGEHG